MQLFDDGQNFIRPQLATVAGAAIPSPYGGKVLQVQVDIDQHALQANGLSATDVVNAVAAQNLVLPAGTEKIGKFEWVVELNASPRDIAELNDLPIKQVNGTVVYVRDVAYVHAGSPPQTNLVRVDGNNAVLMTVLKAGSGFDAGRDQRHSLAAAADRGDAAPGAAPEGGRRSVGIRQIGGEQRASRSRHRRRAHRH